MWAFVRLKKIRIPSETVRCTGKKRSYLAIKLLHALYSHFALKFEIDDDATSSCLVASEPVRSLVADGTVTLNAFLPNRQARLGERLSRLYSRPIFVFLWLDPTMMTEYLSSEVVS